MRTLLVDADMMAHRICVALEKPIDWGDGVHTLHSDATECQVKLDQQIAKVMDAADADAVVLALSDSENFRKELEPTYKANRAGTRKPLAMAAVKQYMLDNYRTFIRPRLEADDVLGILATNPHVIKGEKVIASGDKDLLQIPGLHINLLNLDDGVVSVTVDEGVQRHLMQTLTGDTVDNYPGCPGVGEKKAAKLLDVGAMSQFASKADRHLAQWDAIVAAYGKAGFGEEYALLQARIAKIITHDWYDYKRKEPILWTP